MQASRVRVLCLAAAGLFAACNGNIGALGVEGSGRGGASGGTTGTGSGGSGGIVMPPPAAICAKDPDPGPTPLMKLSTLQYRNTVRDLLAASGLGSVGDTLAPTLASVPDDSPLTFQGLDPRISANHIQAYFNVAVAVGDAVESTPARLTAVAGSCATASATPPLPAKCVDDFLNGFGRRAFRRPLTSAELTSLRQLNDGVRSPAETIRAMIVTLLISPRFVNHLEVEGDPVSGRADLLALSPYELASRLSYTFWQSMPDDALLAAAADGSLATDEGFARQVDRVFTDPRTQQTVWQFWSQWFHLDHFTGFAVERPGFKSLAAGENVSGAGHDVYADMVQEVRDLTTLFVWERNGTLRDLLTTDVSVTKSADLAHLYGVTPWSGSGEYPRITDGSRGGILQRGALLASTLETTNPFHRGALIRREVLCDVLAQPDPNSLPPGSLDPPPVTAAQTTRQRYAAKIAGNGLCNGCHSQFSDLGYVLEGFDSLGRARTVEKVFDEQSGALLATLPLDTTAVARVTLDDTRPVTTPAELDRRIAESGKVEACVSNNYFKYALRRAPVAGGADACLVEGMRAALAAPGMGMADVFKQLALDPSFRRRRIAAP